MVSWQDSVKINIARMKECHISSIRMGEFSWAAVEPVRNHFDFSRFEYALDQAESAGIEVIFCTPTATPPKWLVDEMPNILPITRSGQKIPFGSRRHYDVNNEKYKEESRRITEAYAAALGKHPALVAWQTDNEFGCHNSVFLFTDAARKGFHRWLKEKYQNEIKKLNDDWFCGFWSQHYNSFEQIELPFSSWADQNPHLELDFRRFSNEQYKAFQKDQIEIIKSLSPGRIVTHNLMTLFSDLCPWMAAEDLDKVGFDHYQMDLEPHPLTSNWQFALMRSLRNKPFVVLEQQPLQVNWHLVNRRFDYSWLFLWTFQAAALGADGMFYFSWQRFYGGAEQYHDGIISHDVRVEETWQERTLKSMKQLFAEIKEYFSLEAMPEPVHEVICIFDSESLWSHEITAQSNIYSTRRQIDFVAGLCSSTGLGFGFNKTIGGALQYGTEGNANTMPKLLILPGYAFEFTDYEKAAMERFLAKGGKILSLPRTAMKRRNNQMSPLPLTFLDSEDLCLEDYGALAEGETDKFTDGKHEFAGELWSEKIKVHKNWQVLATFNSGFYEKYPATIKRDVGRGRIVHMATCPAASAPLFTWLLSALDITAAATSPSQLQLIAMQYKERKFMAGLNFTTTEQPLPINNHGSALTARLGENESLVLDSLSKSEARNGCAVVPARSFTLVECS